MGIYLGSNPVGTTIMVEKPDDQYGFLKNSKLIKTVTYDLPLSDTNFSSLTLSTTAQTLTLPATDYTTAGTNVTVDRIGADYDGTIIDQYNPNIAYVAICEGYWTYAYTATDATMDTMIHGIKTYTCRDAQPYKYHNIANDGTANTSWSTSLTYCTSCCQTLYKKVNGTYAATSSVGIYCTSQSISLSSNYIGISLSSVQVKGSDSYFPVTAMQYIDPNNTILHFIWKIYEGEKNVANLVYQTVYNNLVLS